MLETSQQNINDDINDIKNKTKALQEAKAALVKEVSDGKYYQDKLHTLETAKEALIAAEKKLSDLKIEKENAELNEAKAAANKSLSETDAYLKSNNLNNATRREAPVAPASSSPIQPSSIAITPDSKPMTTAATFVETLKTKIQKALQKINNKYTADGDKTNAVVKGADGKPVYFVKDNKVTSTTPLDSKEKIKEALEIAKAAHAPNEITVKIDNATPEQQKWLEEAAKEVGGIKTVAANAAPSPAKQTSSQHHAHSSQAASAPHSKPSAAAGFAGTEKNSSPRGDDMKTTAEDLGYDKLRLTKKKIVKQSDPNNPGSTTYRRQSYIHRSVKHGSNEKSRSRRRTITIRI